jgi:hypothetical protein
MPKDMALRRALELSVNATPNMVCRRAESITVRQLQTLIDQCKAALNYAPLMRVMGAVFSSNESLNLSFTSDAASAPLNFGVDVEGVRSLAIQIGRLTSPEVVAAFSDALAVAIKSLQKEAPQCTSKQSLRQFIVLLEVGD